MPTPQELEDAFWTHLRSDMTVMVGLASEKGETRPLTAQVDGDANAGPIWFFTSRETGLFQKLHGQQPAILTFVSKGHDVFASVSGSIMLDNDRAVIDRLWNTFVAAWYEGGKADPKLALLRFDPQEGQIWENGSSLLAGIKMMLGIDPKADYRDKVATVRMD
ncbi:general stress protein [Phreatobacter aquaticus]|uniref:General stress protein n=1 Tax=Phreatobacter aquaticus TaxID=2570229 RepID=A0A4D7QIS6_9HYPH|nr:pyridoxamine 5'-phosphate oxidase family protein [Phreatobacter aquaticus]QCK87560.1 general stress protein [Phreatobacter aquaticus]